MRLLVIVSSDYGELGTAMYFLKGVATGKSPVVLLLPAALARSATAPAEMEVRTYSNLGEIVHSLGEIRPDTVLLASGYLLAINSALKFADALQLIRMLKRKGVTLLTSDPFLGALPKPWEFDFRSLAERQGRRGGLFTSLARRALYAWVAALVYAHFALLGGQLRRAWHIYPVPIGRMRSRRDVLRMCYFNPMVARVAPAASRPPAWLFVLSKVDFEMHAGENLGTFVAQLALRLVEGVVLDRDVDIIGPEVLIEALRPHIADQPRICGHSDSAYSSYVDRLMAAEYVFFWNYYSFSVLHRVIANLPVFFFDPGHLARILPQFAQEGIRICYDGWRPPLMSIDNPLVPSDLARRADEAIFQFRRISDRLRECPSPQDLLDGIAPGAP